MRTEYRVFAILVAFFAVTTPAYAWWTAADAGRVEVVGTTALGFTGLLTATYWLYSWLVSRRIRPRPEDRPHAEPAEGAGDVGFFSPGSYWPLPIGLATAVTALGAAYWELWLVAVGVVGLLLATGGLLYEYYAGTGRAQH